mgnify:FL=1
MSIQSELSQKDNHIDKLESDLQQQSSESCHVTEEQRVKVEQLESTVSALRVWDLSSLHPSINSYNRIKNEMHLIIFRISNQQLDCKNSQFIQKFRYTVFNLGCNCV